MPSRNFDRSVIIALVGCFFAAPPALAQDRDQRRIQHQVKQANLYIKMKLPDRARELLVKTVVSEPGLSDPLAWLALGRAYYYERRLDDAGRSVERAEQLGVAAAANDQKWARRFLSTYNKHVGALVLDGGACSSLTFDAKLAAPMLNKTRKALLDSVSGWRSGALKRERGEKFFLPAGRYRLGAQKVNVLAGEMARVSADEIEARCPAPPRAVAAARAAPPPGGTLGPVTVAAQDEPSWFEDNWVWVVVGAAVVVAGGTAAAVAVASSGGPDQVNFDPNPTSIRGN